MRFLGLEFRPIRCFFDLDRPMRFLGSDFGPIGVLFYVTAYFPALIEIEKYFKRFTILSGSGWQWVID